MSLFGSRLKGWRVEHRLSQGKLGATLGVNQATISQWEQGKQRPEDEVLAKLSELMQCTVQSLKTDLEFAGDASEGPRWMREGEYMVEQQKLIRNIKYNLDFCLIGPDTLHLADSSLVESAWIENLANGADYRIIWFLDYVKRGTFLNVGPPLRKIGEATKGRGRIVHYAAFGYSNPDDDQSTVRENKRDYEELGEELKDYNNIFLAEYDFAGSPNERKARDVRRRLLKYWNTFGSISAIRPRSKTQRGMAALVLRNVKPGLEMPPMDTWVFFEREAVNEIVEIMSDVKDVCEELKPSLQAPELAAR